MNTVNMTVAWWLGPALALGGLFIGIRFGKTSVVVLSIIGGFLAAAFALDSTGYLVSAWAADVRYALPPVPSLPTYDELAALIVRTVTGSGMLGSLFLFVTVALGCGYAIVVGRAWMIVPAAAVTILAAFIL